MSFLHLVRCTPIGEASGQVDIFVISLGQADLLVRHNPLVETSHGQVWYYFRQADLWSDVPPSGEASGQVDIFVISLGQADLWSDIPPGRDISWPSMALLQAG